jgi:hypothetical protein
MAEAVGSAPMRVAALIRSSGGPKEKRRGEHPRRSSIETIGVGYFDTDFLNMRSIFSFVASQQAWLA